MLVYAGCGEARGELAQEALESTSSSDRGATAGRALPDESVRGPVELVGYDAGAPAAPESPMVHAGTGGAGGAGAPPSVPDAGVNAPAEPPAAPTTEPDAAVADAAPPDDGEDDGLLGLSVCDLLESLLCAEGLECIDGVCTQRSVCVPDKNCEAECTSSACSLDCGDAEACKADCGDSSQCDVSCVGTKSCEPTCRGGNCEIDCQAAEKCDHVRCKDGAACLIQCGVGPCKLEECDAPLECPGNVLVCNRACPVL